jgi:hypothetical protein
MCGETWWEKALRLGSKNMPRLSNLFSPPQSVLCSDSPSSGRRLGVAGNDDGYFPFFAQESAHIVKRISLSPWIYCHRLWLSKCRTRTESPVISGHLPKKLTIQELANEDFESRSGPCGWKSRASRVCSTNYRHQ